MPMFPPTQAHRLRRPTDAAFPASERPQLSNAGHRPRPSHLPRSARLHPGQQPQGLPNLIPATDATKGHSYRNAAFQVLLNAPIFLNFLRSHSHLVRVRYDGTCKVNASATVPKCLTCAMGHLASEYWVIEPSGASNVRKDEALRILWQLCLDTFWGKKRDGGRGPADTESEFYVDSFLLNLLDTMQRQLEVVPGEWQTFLRIFTTHFVARRKCHASCGWSSAKWASTFYLPLDVQKPSGRNIYRTLTLDGVHRGFSRLARQFDATSEPDHVNARCPRCFSLADREEEIVNFPELMIVVPNIDGLPPSPPFEVSYDQNLDFTSLGPIVNRQTDRLHASPLPTDFTTLYRTYTLATGTGLLRYRSSRDMKRSVAFARGPSDEGESWFYMQDEIVEQFPGLASLDARQRIEVHQDGSVTDLFVLPELFIYRRTDNGNWRVDYNIQGADPNSPGILDSDQRKRDLLARSMSEVFTQRIGQGLLKFKIKCTPSDPAPQDAIAFSLEIGYEHNNCHWALDDKFKGRLIPTGEQTVPSINYTPFEDEPAARFERNQASTPSHRFHFAGDDDHNSWNHHNPEFSPHSYLPSINPFTTRAAARPSLIPSENAMDLDPAIAHSFIDQPHIRNHIEFLRTRDMKTALDRYTDESGWQKNWPTKEKKDGADDGRGGKGVRRGRRGGRGGGKEKHHGDSGAGSGRGRVEKGGSDRRGRGRGRGRGKGKGRGSG